MRLDALIIFHIEWQHQVSSLVGKQSKYWSKKGKTENHVFFKSGWKPSQKMRLDALIIFHIEWQHQVSSLVGKQSKYWSRKNEDQGHPKGIERSSRGGVHSKSNTWRVWPYKNHGKSIIRSAEAYAREKYLEIPNLNEIQNGNF